MENSVQLPSFLPSFLPTKDIFYNSDFKLGSFAILAMFNGITLPEVRSMDVGPDWIGAIKQSLEGSSDHSP